VQLVLFALFVFAVNVPFGWWRQSVRKFSPLWFVAVHAAVPLIIAARLLTEYGWHWSQVPVLVAAYFGGQWVGARGRARSQTGSSPG
jgi:hypothetical protein